MEDQDADQLADVFMQGIDFDDIGDAEEMFKQMEEKYEAEKEEITSAMTMMNKVLEENKCNEIKDGNDDLQYIYELMQDDGKLTEIVQGSDGKRDKNLQL